MSQADAADPLFPLSAVAKENQRDEKPHQDESKRSSSVMSGEVEYHGKFSTPQPLRVASDNKTAGGDNFSKQELHKLKRKADRYLLPLMWLCYGIQQTDKTSLGTQAIFGLREDTGLVGQQYSWLTTIFYM